MTLKKARIIFHPKGLLYLLLVDFLLFWDVLWPWGSRVLSDGGKDLAIHFLWWRQFGFEQLREGNLPLWNPHFLCGTPFLGGFQAGLLYPPNWLYLLLPLPFALNFEMVLHVFLAGAFTYLWGSVRGWGQLSCVLAGMTYMLSGAFFLHLYPGHLPNLDSMAWAPLIFLAFDLLLGFSWRSGVLLGTFALSMQVLAGHPQYLLFTGILGLFYMMVNLPGRMDKRKVIGGVLTIYLGAGLLTAAQLWTGIQAFLECSRSVPMTFLSAASFSFPPQNLMTAILPDFFGDPSKGHYWSQWYFWEGSLFLGCTAFLLALLTLGGEWKRGERPLWICAVFSLLLAFGAYTPLYKFLYEFLPFFGGMRGVGKFTFLSTLFLAMLCGAGMERWASAWVPFKGWALGAVSTSVFFAMAGVWVSMSSGQGVEGTWGKFLTGRSWLAGIWKDLDPSILEILVRSAGKDCGKSLLMGALLFFALACLFPLRRIHRGHSILALVAIGTFELVVHAYGHRPTFDLGSLKVKADSLKDFYLQDPGDYRVIGTGAAALGTHGFDLWEDEPMVLGRYGRFIARTQGIQESEIFSTSPLFKGIPDIYGMLRLRYRIHWGEDPLRIQPMPFQAAPRMFLVGDWEVLPGEERVLDRCLSPGFDPLKKVLLEKDPGMTPKGPLVGGRVSWKGLDTDALEVQVKVPQDALLVVTDNYASGWKAIGLPESDGKIYRVMPGNGILRVIPLPAGSHHFTLVYEPMVFSLGKWVSILSILVYVGILFRFVKKRPSIRPVFHDHPRDLPE